MPKKSTYSRSAAQRNKARQKSFEVVRSTDSSTLEAEESSDEIGTVAVTEPELEEEQSEKAEEEAEEQAIPALEIASLATVGVAAASTNNAPKSVSSRLAARRKSGQRSQKAPTQMISAESYGYVRKDLYYILILAIILFAAIVVMHFIPAIGG